MSFGNFQRVLTTDIFAINNNTEHIRILFIHRVMFSLSFIVLKHLHQNIPELLSVLIVSCTPSNEWQSQRVRQE